ncbi:unnamed protein product, partial [Rotaria sp. Silwood1]
VILKQRQTHRTTRNRKSTGYQQLSRRKPFTTISKFSSRRYAASSQLDQTII